MPARRRVTEYNDTMRRVVAHRSHRVLAAVGLPVALATGVSSLVAVDDSPPSVPHIVGGTDAAPGQFPWNAKISLYLGYDRENGDIVAECSGALIAPTWVLTAAHCIEDRYVPKLSAVRIGDLRAGQGGEEIAVADVFADPAFFSLFASSAHDIGLVKLARPSTATPARLLDPATSALAKPGVTARVVGWGTVVPLGVNAPLTNVYTPATTLQTYTGTLAEPTTAEDLEKAVDAAAADIAADLVPEELPIAERIELEVMLASKIRPTLQRRSDLFDEMMISNPTASACFGDSGGPVLVPDASGSPVIAGVVSNGRSCVPSSGWPTRASRLAMSTPFLARTMGADFPFAVTKPVGGFHRLPPATLIKKGAVTITPPSSTPVQVSGVAGVPTGAQAVLVDLRTQELNEAELDAQIEAAIDADDLDALLALFETQGRVAFHSCAEYERGESQTWTSTSPLNELIVIPLDADGRVCVSGSPVPFEATVFGWFGADGVGFTADGVSRVFDSRSLPRPTRGRAARTARGLKPAQAITLPPITGPAGATGAQISVTVASPVDRGVIAVSACAELPGAPAMDFNARRNESGPTVVPVGVPLCVISSASTDVVIDVTGWFTGTGSVLTAPSQRVRPVRTASPAPLDPVEQLIADLSADGVIDDDDIVRIDTLVSLLDRDVDFEEHDFDRLPTIAELGGQTTTRYDLSDLSMPADATGALAFIRLLGLPATDLDDRPTGYPDVFAVAHRCDAPPPPLSIVTAPTGFDAAVEVFVPIADGQVCITTNIDFQPALWIDGWVTR